MATCTDEATGTLDFDRSTFVNFLYRLLDKKNFNLHKDVNGTLLLVPRWTDCMSFEFEVRKEAYRLCREAGSGIKDALWTTIENTEHRMIHWLQLISIAKSRPGGGDYPALERKVNDLQREVRGRFRSLRRKGGNTKPKVLSSSSQPLALANAPQHKNLFKGKDRVENHNQKKGKSTGSGRSRSKDVNALTNAGREITNKFFANDDSICNKYQRNTCTDNKCGRRHICIGCGKKQAI